MDQEFHREVNARAVSTSTRTAARTSSRSTSAERSPARIAFQSSTVNSRCRGSSRISLQPFSRTRNPGHLGRSAESGGGIVTTILSRVEKEEAAEFGLTLPERRIAKSMNVSAAAYARHKREIADEEELKMEQGAVAAEAIAKLMPPATGRDVSETDSPKAGIPEESVAHLERLP